MLVETWEITREYSLQSSILCSLIGNLSSIFIIADKTPRKCGKAVKFSLCIMMKGSDREEDISRRENNRSARGGTEVSS